MEKWTEGLLCRDIGGYVHPAIGVDKREARDGRY